MFEPIMNCVFWLQAAGYVPVMEHELPKSCHNAGLWSEAFAVCMQRALDTTSDLRLAESLEMRLLLRIAIQRAVRGSKPKEDARRMTTVLNDFISSGKVQYTYRQHYVTLLARQSRDAEAGKCRGPRPEIPAHCIPGGSNCRVDDKMIAGRSSAVMSSLERLPPTDANHPITRQAMRDKHPPQAGRPTDRAPRTHAVDGLHTMLSAKRRQAWRVEGEESHEPPAGFQRAPDHLISENFPLPSYAAIMGACWDPESRGRVAGIEAFMERKIDNARARYTAQQLADSNQASPVIIPTDQQLTRDMVASIVSGFDNTKAPGQGQIPRGMFRLAFERSSEFTMHTALIRTALRLVRGDFPPWFGMFLNAGKGAAVKKDASGAPVYAARPRHH